MNSSQLLVLFVVTCSSHVTIAYVILSKEQPDRIMTLQGLLIDSYRDLKQEVESQLNYNTGVEQPDTVEQDDIQPIYNTAVEQPEEQDEIQPTDSNNNILAGETPMKDNIGPHRQQGAIPRQEHSLKPDTMRQRRSGTRRRTPTMSEWGQHHGRVYPIQKLMPLLWNLEKRATRTTDGKPHQWFFNNPYYPIQKLMPVTWVANKRQGEK